MGNNTTGVQRRSETTYIGKILAKPLSANMG
jgi:hypothetical protein